MTTKLPQITVDHHFAIANVAARPSQMEIHIEKTVAKGLLNQLKTTESLLKNLGSDRVVGVLKSILLDAAPEEKRRIDHLIKTIVDLRTKRNEILHWTWHSGLEDDEAIGAGARPFREFRYSSMKADQIQQIADEAVYVSCALC